jgi:hypothetical protein
LTVQQRWAFFISPLAVARPGIVSVESAKSRTVV